jgi:transposase-like protein
VKQIRNLLLDCRAALRKEDPGFEQTPLRALLDDTIIELGQADSRKAAESAPVPDTPAAQRVAYAWQSVARELRHSQPQLYQQLSDKVLSRLDVEALDDAADEIDALQARLRERDEALAKLAAELAALRSALAAAVPLADTVGGSEAELAQRRLQLLLQTLSQGGGLPKATSAAKTDEDFAPSRALLQAVAAGERGLGAGQR